MKETQVWHCNPSMVSTEHGFIGSILYEEYGSDTIRLSFVTSKPNADGEWDNDEEQIDYPQENMMQNWIVDYPLLAYKTASPTNKEIAVIHMALTMPQRVIHLGEWDFVCFVNHTQMIEQKLFDKSKETNCDIMFIVRRKEKYRLMSFKSNPWLEYHEQAFVSEDSDIYKQTVFLFSGKIAFTPTEEADSITETVKQQYNRRFNSDKIQAVQLLSQKIGNYEQLMLIMQFNDCVVQASLNVPSFKFLCQPQDMIRRHLVRGYEEKVFYVENAGSAIKV